MDQVLQVVALFYNHFFYIIRLKIRLSSLVVDKVLNKTKSQLVKDKLISPAPFLMFTFLVSVKKWDRGVELIKLLTCFL